MPSPFVLVLTFIHRKSLLPLSCLQYVMWVLNSQCHLSHNLNYHFSILKTSSFHNTMFFRSIILSFFAFSSARKLSSIHWHVRDWISLLCWVWFVPRDIFLSLNIIAIRKRPWISTSHLMLQSEQLIIWLTVLHNSRLITHSSPLICILYSLSTIILDSLNIRLTITFLFLSSLQLIFWRVSY